MNITYKTKGWRALSNEQYFSKYSLLDICRCVFDILL